MPGFPGDAMAGNLSDYAENQLMKWLLRTDSVSRPTTWFLALHTAAPGEAGAVGEIPTSKGYARQAAAFAAVSGGVTSNNAQIEFGPATDNWGKVTHFTIWTAASGGNCLFWGTFRTPKTINYGQRLQLPAGTVQATLS